MKIIRIESCQVCPYHGTCKAWNKLTKSQRMQLVIGNNTPKEFILSNCHLDGDLEVDNKEGK